jgi:hypothetical protein
MPPTTKVSNACCGRCNADPPTAPIRSRYRDPRMVEHDWCCNACGNEWTTSTQV